MENGRRRGEEGKAPRGGLIVEESKVQRNVGPKNPVHSKQDDLPELLRGVYYAEESTLLEDLEKNGFRDLHIVLKDDGYAVWREMRATTLSN